jgi:hypothetical protein
MTRYVLAWFPMLVLAIATAPCDNSSLPST